MFVLFISYYGDVVIVYTRALIIDMIKYLVYNVKYLATSRRLETIYVSVQELHVGPTAKSE